MEKTGSAVSNFLTKISTLRCVVVTHVVQPVYIPQFCKITITLLKI